MYNAIYDNLKEQLGGDFSLLENKKWHLGIFTEPYLTYMLNGKKTIESRFSKNKIVPYGKISKDDIVIIKKSGGDILAYFTIKEVKSFNLEDTNITDIKNKYNDYLLCSEEFWEEKKTSRYATLIFIDKIHMLKPFHIDKKGMQTWIVLN